MVFSYQELLKNYGNQRQVDQALSQGKIYRLGRGFYSDQPALSVEYVQKRYPQTILTLKSAFYHYGLSDEAPSVIEVASPLGSTRIKDPGVKQSFQIIGIFTLGKVCQNNIVIYDKERLLVELFRLRKRFSYEYFKEVLASYRSIADSIDFYKVASYLNKMSCGKNLLKEIKEVF
jgi:hypothetical protein